MPPDAPQAPQQPAAGPKTVSQMLGEVTWLLTQSPLHARNLFLADLEWFVMPALMLEQYRVWYGPQPGTPAGVALYALVTPEAEARLEAGASRLAPHEWRGGDRPWLVELVAPFGGQQEMLDDLAATVFPGTSFKFHRTTPDGKREVATWPQKMAG